MEGMKNCYAGLFDSALSTGHFTSVKVRSLQAQLFALINFCTLSLMLFYSSIMFNQVLECVVRPDIELKRLMAAVLRIAHSGNLHSTLLQRSHATLTPIEPDEAWRRVSGSTLGIDKLDALARRAKRIAMRWGANVEWDHIDVQVR
jgi:hypothetical protein